MTGSRLLEDLRPQDIGWLFGRKCPGLDGIRVVGRARPIVRFWVLFWAGMLIVPFLALLEHALVLDHGERSALGAILSAPRHVGKVGMPLALDPAGWIALLVTLATPLYCAYQVEAIGRFVASNEQNLPPGGRAGLAQHANAINERVEQANRGFKWLGGGRVSLALCALAGIASYVLYRTLQGHAALRSWNPTQAPDATWRKEVFSGWWANGHEHPVVAGALIVLGWYMFYFLFKQLAMGVVFARFARHAVKLEFGVTPNLEYDSDGYSGLRWLRRFMLATYLSSLSHFVITLGVFVVWLPLSPATLFACLVLAVINVGLVIYPSVIAHANSIRIKSLHARWLSDQRLSVTQKQAQIASVWSAPSLPFRTRSSLTAAGIYVVAPLLLAVVSALIGK
jgi:hypothetical protein